MFTRKEIVAKITDFNIIKDFKAGKSTLFIFRDEKLVI